MKIKAFCKLSFVFLCVFYMCVCLCVCVFYTCVCVCFICVFYVCVCFCVYVLYAYFMCVSVCVLYASFMCVSVCVCLCFMCVSVYVKEIDCLNELCLQNVMNWVSRPDRHYALCHATFFLLHTFYIT